MSNRSKIDLPIFLLFLLALLAPALAQVINEEQLLLNGYVDTSGDVMLTGYASPSSLSYMSFLDGTNYTFDNNTNQLHAITNVLTSKNQDTWSLNFTLDGYYSDYAVTFYLPPGSKVTRFDIHPQINYQFQVREDSLVVSLQGYRVESPYIIIDYKLPATASTDAGQSISIINYALPASFIIVLAAGAGFAFYRHRRQKITVIPEGKENTDREANSGTNGTKERKEIPVSSGMQKVIDTLSEKEKEIIGLLLKNCGSVTQADIRYKTGIPRSSLTGIINALKRKNIIKKQEHGRTNIIQISEWFLSEKEPK